MASTPFKDAVDARAKSLGHGFGSCYGKASPPIQHCGIEVYFPYHSGLVLMPNGKDTFTTHYHCAVCGQLFDSSGVPTGLTGQVTGPQSNVRPVAQAMRAAKSYRYDMHFEQWGDSITIKDTMCECGAHKTGAANKSPLHSSWCPEYSNASPKRSETQEELVARVRAGRKGAQSTP